MHVPHGPGPIVAASRDISRRSVIVGAGFAGIAAAFAAAGWRVDVLAQDATPPSGPPPVQDQNALVFLYGQPTDPAAFQDYMMNTHLPLASTIPGLQEFIAHLSLVSVDGADSDLYQIGTVLFAGPSELGVALESEEAQAAFADLANFTTGGFTAYLSNVLSIPVSPSTSPEASSTG